MGPRFQYCSKKCRIAPRFRGRYCIQCGSRIIVDLGSSHRVKHCSTACANKTNFEKRYPDFNEDYFAVPNLENSYWAGFIAADGCIHPHDTKSSQLVIQLKSSDGHHLKHLQTSIKSGSLLDSGSKTRYRVSSNKICDDLKHTYNITPRKTFTLEPPELTDNLAYAYVAGYIDGDGCYDSSKGRPRLRILGTFSILEWMSDIYNLDRNPTKRPEENIYRLELHGNDAINVRKSFEQLDLPLLDRKKSRWEELGLNLSLLRRSR